jgi:hypothetical protein
VIDRFRRKNAVDFQPDIRVFQYLFYIRHSLFETAVFPVDILGEAVEAEYNRKFVQL